jgi:hypothetical protein
VTANAIALAFMLMAHRVNLRRFAVAMLDTASSEIANARHVFFDWLRCTLNDAKPMQ